MSARQTIAILSAAAALACLTSCNEARLQPNNTAGQGAPLQRNSLRAVISAQGLARLIELSAPQGLRAEAAALALDGPAELDVTIGALSQDMALSQREVTFDEGRGAIRLTLQTRQLPIALRVQASSGLRICRYEVSAEAITIDVDLRVFVDGEGQAVLEADGTPRVELAMPQVGRLGTCPVLEGREDGFSPPLADALVGFTREALELGASRLVNRRLSEDIGVILGNQQLTRQSAFGNRNGRMLIVGALDAAAPVQITSEGVELGLDYALQAVRAACARPRELDAPMQAQAGDIDETVLAQFRADVGLALAQQVLERGLQAAVLGGFFCRGIETADGQLPREELLLADLGLDEVPLGDQVAVVTTPGDLPQLRLRPSNNAMSLRFEGFSLDLYGTFDEIVPMHLLQVQLDFEVAVRLKAAASGAIGFDVVGIAVERAGLSSDWLDTPPDADVVQRWAERLLIVVLADNIVVPMPLEPASALNLAGSQIRADDIVLYLRFADAT